MRILHLISSNRLYGSARVAIDLSKSLKMMYGCEPIIGIIGSSQSPHTEIIDEAEVNGINTVIFPCRGKFDIKTVSAIRKLIRKDKIDLIHCHGYKSNFYGLLSSKNKIPTITTNHNWLKSHWKLKIYCFLDALWIRYFDRIVAVSDEIKRDMLKYRIPGKKIRIVDNGINIERFNKEISSEDIRRELGINGDVKVIGTVGGLKEEKGYEYLLKAAKGVIETHKSIKFIFIGDGSLRKHLEDETSKLGIQNNVIFAGYRKDIPEVLSVFDIFVLPSIKEGLPMVLLEAMAAKKPVIATRVGAVPKVIDNHENGILIEPKNINDLQQAILHLLNDEGKRHHLAHEGYLIVKKSFSSETVCKKYFNLYKELMS